MNYEKLYKESLERARECMKDGGISQNTIDYLCNIFPELAESEDERIRKDIIRVFKGEISYSSEEENEKYIDWLEKQSEKTHQTPRWMINFLNENRCRFASSMDDYDEQREAGGKLDAIIDWLEKQGEQKPIEEVNGEDYGIDGLYHAQRILEKTFGKVDGYQTDDGILSHECAISAVKKLYEQKPVWSEEDDKKLIQAEQKSVDNKEKLDVLNFIRKETCCGLAEADNALSKLIKVLKEHPFPIMDKSHKLKIEWEEQKPQGKIALEAIKEENEKSKFGQYKEEGDIIITADDGVLRTFKKIEPKFNIGDWVVGSNNVCKITSLNNELNCYIAVTINNEEIKIPYYFDDGPSHMCSYHLWSIEDAKDHDILTIDGRPFIYCCNDDYKGNYCCIDSDGVFRTSLDFGFNGKTILPATKEQCDLLFEMMRNSPLNY